MFEAIVKIISYMCVCALGYLLGLVYSKITSTRRMLKKYKKCEERLKETEVKIIAIEEQMNEIKEKIYKS